MTRNTAREIAVHLSYEMNFTNLTAGELLDQRLTAESFAALAASLDAMSPLKVLGRGYAMAQNEQGQIMKSYRDAAPGDRVSVTLGEGGFAARVEEVHP